MLKDENKTCLNASEAELVLQACHLHFTWDCLQEKGRPMGAGWEKDGGARREAW